MVDDMEAQAVLTDTVNRSVADQLQDDQLQAKREKKVGHSYVDEETAAAARLAVKSYQSDLTSVSGSLEDRYGPANAPFVRSTPGPDDAPAFSASEKSATKDSENKLVVEEPDVLTAETIKDAPSVLEAGVLGEPSDVSLTEVEVKDEESSVAESTTGESLANGDDLKPDKPVKKATPAKKVAGK